MDYTDGAAEYALPKPADAFMTNEAECGTMPLRKVSESVSRKEFWLTF